MSQAIYANYTFNEDEFITAQRYHVQFSGRRMRWLRWAYLGITVATATTILVTQDVWHPMMLIILALGYLGVIAAEVMQHPKMLARSIHKRFEQGIYQTQQVSFTITETDVTTQTDGRHETQILWADVQKVVETPDGFLMYLNKQSFLWVPLTALRPDDVTKSLREIWQAQSLTFIGL